MAIVIPAVAIVIATRLHRGAGQHEDDAQKGVRALTAEGFDSLAKTWERIVDAIREMQGTETGQTDGYRAALRKGVLISE